MSSQAAVLSRFRNRPWIWSFLGAILVWALAVVLAGGHGAWPVFTTALAFPCARLACSNTT